MKVIGIVGGIASGKSLVAELLQSLGAEVLDVDRMGHDVLDEPEVQAALRQRWGNDVFSSTGQVNRRAVAQHVFGSDSSADELRFLEQWTHPRIGQRIADRLQVFRDRGDVSVVVLDAPLLVKAGWDAYCDFLIFVDVERAIRENRASERGWSIDELRAREAAQGSLDERRRRADWTVDNSRTRLETRHQVEKIWQRLNEFSLRAPGP